MNNIDKRFLGGLIAIKRYCKVPPTLIFSIDEIFRTQCPPIF